MNKKKTKSQLTEIEKFCLDAYLINKDADMCFTLSRKRTLTATPENVHRLALRWLRNDFVKDYLSERQAMLNQTSTNKQKENGNRTKEQLIDELNILHASLTAMERAVPVDAVRRRSTNWSSTRRLFRNEGSSVE